MKSLDRVFRYIFIYFPFILIFIDFKQERSDHRRSDSLLTFKCERSAHLFCKAFRNRHAQTGTAKFRSASLFLLRKWLEQMSLEFFTHTNSCISAQKFDLYLSGLIRWEFSATQIDMTIFLVVFYCVGQNIYQNTFQVDWAAD